jgi:hypothetical protein
MSKAGQSGIRLDRQPGRDRRAHRSDNRPRQGSPSVAGKGTINKIDLSKGSFEVNIAKFVSHPPPPVDPKTCSFADSFTASAPIVKGTGTGAYAGIRGTFKVTVTNAGILPKLKSGKCNESPNATPVAGVSWAKGPATVSFK